MHNKAAKPEKPIEGKLLCSPTNRRLFLGSVATLAAGIMAGPGLMGCSSSRGAGSAASAAAGERYKIGVVDLMILRRQKIGAFPLAAEIGVDGVEVDMGGLGNRDTFESKLVDPVVRQEFLDKAKEHGLDICSIAMSGFYAQSFAERPTFQQMVGDTIKTMQHMGVKVGFLPLGVTGDLLKYPELRPAIVERLKVIGKMAEDGGVVIGIETALDAKGEKQLLKDIDSPGVKIYFNFSDALEAGLDLQNELRILGRDNICMIHCTDKDGVLLKDNTRLDMHAVKDTLDKMGWSGWLVLERSRDANDPHNTKRNFGSNAAYMKSIFQ